MQSLVLYKLQETLENIHFYGVHRSKRHNPNVPNLRDGWNKWELANQDG